MNILLNELFGTPEVVLSLNAIERSGFLPSRLDDRNGILYTVLDIDGSTFLAETTRYVDVEGNKDHRILMTDAIEDVGYVPILSDDTRQAHNARTRWLIPDLTNTGHIMSQIEHMTGFFKGRHYRLKQTGQIFLLVHVSLLRASGTCVLAFNYIEVDESGEATHPIVIQTRPAYDFYGNRYFVDVSESFRT